MINRVEYQREYRKANPEKYKERTKKTNNSDAYKQWRRDHPEYMAEYGPKYKLNIKNHCVYNIIEDGNIIYVGSCWNIDNRMYKHNTIIKHQLKKEVRSIHKYLIGKKIGLNGLTMNIVSDGYVDTIPRKKAEQDLINKYRKQGILLPFNEKMAFGSKTGKTP